MKSGYDSNIDLTSKLKALHETYAVWMQNTINACGDSRQRFLAANSYLPSATPHTFPLTRYAIDCGGTNTRVVRFDQNSNTAADKGALNENRPNEAWMTPNYSCSSDIHRLPIDNYFDSIIEHILLTEHHEVDRIKNIAIIWSNAGSSHPHVDKRVKGMTIKASGIIDGTDYRKNEPYTVGLTDGFDIGEAFIAAANRKGILLERLIIANDTVFVAAAAKNPVHAAGVNSSGSNMATIIKGYWANLESGARILVPSDFETDYEHQISDKTIESFIAGKWLTQRLAQILKDWSSKDPIEAKTQTAHKITQSVASGEFTAKNFAECYLHAKQLHTETQHLPETLQKLKVTLGLNADWELKRETMEELAVIIEQLGTRAILLTGVLIANALTAVQINADRNSLPTAASYHVAMDSRVIDGLDPDARLLTETVSMLIEKPTTIELLGDKNQISVPIQGAIKSFYFFP